MTYRGLVDATPTSKKRRYHGVEYCFSNHDSSQDSKLTKIQQRYLVSERASHCSTISTPKDLRAMREIRRKRKAEVRTKLEAKSGPAILPKNASTQQEEKERGVSVGGASGGGGRTRKGAGNKGKEAVSGPVESREKEAVVGLENEEVSKRLKVGEEKSLRTKDGGVDKVKGKAGEGEGRTNSSRRKQGSQPDTNPKGKGKVKLKGSVESDQGTASERKRKRKNLKTLLGLAVVDALKGTGMPRDHQNFRACYNRLFNLSKTFMEVRKGSHNVPICYLFVPK